MTDRVTGSLNEDGDDVLKPKKKIHTVLLGTIIALIIIFINSGTFGIGGEKKEESQEYVALEQALMKMKGVGEVSIYFHYNDGEEVSPLSDYFSLSSSSTKKVNPLQGILVIAEGAEDPRIRSELSKILSAVLQVPEHRIVITEMTKRGKVDESE
ncbi:hypothetical protein [Sporosarcina sp. G11-34]|uniref:hypothetical protein n=1 Tax=Sporosarcina sp. G11-34 TaxID=2849605 RepID=UPI0022A9B527|nr:hypothetical protein [Sporosarcina sp. G11-34]MCZ2260104.1 hypothetical protein [Sporosarcina sp. G11-34]